MAPQRKKALRMPKHDTPITQKRDPPKKNTLKPKNSSGIASGVLGGMRFCASAKEGCMPRHNTPVMQKHSLRG